MLKNKTHPAALVAASLLILTTACRSHFVQATITNEGGSPLRIVEIDYPGASFGVSTIEPHGMYKYRFKALSSGPLTLSYTDAAGGAHTSTGPVIEEGQAGSLGVQVGVGGVVHWEPAFSSR